MSLSSVPYQSFGKIKRETFQKSIFSNNPIKNLHQFTRHQSRAALIKANLNYKTKETSISDVNLKSNLKNGNKNKNQDQIIPKTIPDIWNITSKKFEKSIAVEDPHIKPNVKLTYKELREKIMLFASGLQKLGLRQRDTVCLFSDNSARWIIADQGVMMNGAADAVRGSQSTVEELEYIISHTNCTGVILQDRKLFNRISHILQDRKYKIKFIIILWDQLNQAYNDLKFESEYNIKVYSYDEFMNFGNNYNFKPIDIKASDVATLVYTSGTSGFPKGVMLTHANIIYQITHFSEILKIDKNDKMLSLLPPWHIYERTVDYFTFYNGIHMIYSSVKTFKSDLAKYPPDIFVCVPLILETLYNKVISQLKKSSHLKKAITMFLLNASITYTRNKRAIDGKDINYALQPISLFKYIHLLFIICILYPLHFLAQKIVHAKILNGIGIKKVVISGGGSLGNHLDDFFEAIGLKVINGWGLTETSPVLACRRTNEKNNIRGSVGIPMSETELKIVNPETDEEVEDGTRGLIVARGPGIMAGYYKNKRETDRVFKMGDGWFNTGDCGWKCPKNVNGSKMAGHIILTGRIKDTIVLSNGENLEPQPIEDYLSTSPLMKYVMLIGQDRRHIGAFVVPDPDMLEDIQNEQGKELTESELKIMIKNEIKELEMKNYKLRPFETITEICILKNGFSIENETLTRTMKIRREAIIKLYKRQYDDLMKKLR